METPSIEINKSVGDAGPRTSLVVDDVRVLPRALTKLHEMGYDLSGVIEAVDEIKEKRKAAQTAGEFKAIAREYIEKQRKTSRRFVVVYAREHGIFRVAEGVEFGNGKLYIDGPEYPIHGLKNSRQSYEHLLANNGYSYHIEYID